MKQEIGISGLYKYYPYDHINKEWDLLNKGKHLEYIFNALTDSGKVDINEDTYVYNGDANGNDIGNDRLPILLYLINIALIGNLPIDQLDKEISNYKISNAINKKYENGHTPLSYYFEIIYSIFDDLNNQFKAVNQELQGAQNDEEKESCTKEKSKILKEWKSHHEKFGPLLGKLWEMGADINATSPKTGLPPIFEAIKYYEHTKEIWYLFSIILHDFSGKQGEKRNINIAVNIDEVENCTPLHYATLLAKNKTGKMEEVIKELLMYNAVNEIDIFAKCTYQGKELTFLELAQEIGVPWTIDTFDDVKLEYQKLQDKEDAKKLQEERRKEEERFKNFKQESTNILNEYHNNNKQADEDHQKFMDNIERRKKKIEDNQLYFIHIENEYENNDFSKPLEQEPDENNADNNKQIDKTNNTKMWKLILPVIGASLSAISLSFLYKELLEAKFLQITGNVVYSDIISILGVSFISGSVVFGIGFAYNKAADEEIDVKSALKNGGIAFASTCGILALKELCHHLMPEKYNVMIDITTVALDVIVNTVILAIIPYILEKDKEPSLT